MVRQMNEAILRLAKKAGFDSELMEHNHNKGNPSIAEKFAELIVGECLSLCEQVRSDAAIQKKSEFLTESGKMLYEGVYGGATNCGFAIQQHFGVEEK